MEADPLLLEKTALFEKQTFDYDTYRQWIKDLVADNRTSGPLQSETYIGYTRLNLARMERQHKTLQLIPELENLEGRLRPMNWEVITEAWCGDAAQTLPAIYMIAKLLHIPLTLTLRDAHPEKIERYLTNGARAIPKLIMRDRTSGEDLAVWGPRPAPAQKIVLDSKAAGIPSDEWHITLHKWYSSDKSFTLQSEMLQLLQTLTV